MTLDIQKSGFKTYQAVSVCGVDMLFIFNSCQIRTLLQYDLSLMTAILSFRQSEGCQGSDIVLVEFLSVENMGLDTKMKSLPFLPKNILATL